MKSFQNNIRILFVGLLLMIPAAMFGQQERKYIRKGNRLYEKQKFPGSEIQYRRAQGIDKPVPDANFNVGDALYKQKKYSEAAEQFEQSLNAYKTPEQVAEAYYNKGNALLKDQKYQESIESYKNSLKYTPDNPEAKYNLAYAQRMLKKQQEQQQKQDQQNKDQDKNKQDQNKDKQNQNKDQDKDKQDQNQNKDQDKNKQDQNKDQNKQDQNQNQNQDQNQQNNSAQQPRMSKEDAKRLLDALSANEKEVQEKVNKDKKEKGYVRVTKNW